MKKEILFLMTGFLLFLFPGCATGTQTSTNPVVSSNETVKDTPQIWMIKDYQDRGNGGAIPSWVSAWLDGGNTGVEALEEFQDSFIFVAVNSGNNFRSLKQWQDGFSPELDFARLAAIRIENRFLSSLTGYPDNEYGSYFETLIKAASDMAWNGAERKDDFWIVQEFSGSESDGDAEGIAITETEPIPSETYVFFILVTVEKTVLVPQLNSLLRNTRPVPPITREQNNAVNRVQTRFFDGF